MNHAVIAMCLILRMPKLAEPQYTVHSFIYAYIVLFYFVYDLDRITPDCCKNQRFGASIGYLLRNNSDNGRILVLERTVVIGNPVITTAVFQGSVRN